MGAIMLALIIGGLLDTHGYVKEQTMRGTYTPLFFLDLVICPNESDFPFNATTWFSHCFLDSESFFGQYINLRIVFNSKLYTFLLTSPTVYQTIVQEN